MSVIFRASILTGFELRGTAFVDCCNISRHSWAMKLASRRMFTASLSGMWDTTVKKSTRHTFK